MSPEQLLEKELTPSSDLYSVGLITYEMLMGREVLQGNRWAEQLDRLVAGHVFVIPEMESVGPALRTIVERMCAREPEHRYASAEEVLAALDSVDTGVLTADAATARMNAIAGDGPPPSPAPHFVAETTPEPPAESPGLGVHPAILVVAAVALVIAIVVPLTTIILHEEPGPALPTPNKAPLAIAAVARDMAPSAPETFDLASAPSVDLATAAPDLGEPAPPADGCGTKTGLIGGANLFNMEETFAQREVRVHIPKSYDPDRRYPVVMLFHQDLRSPQFLIEQTGFDKLADKRGFIVMAPAPITTAAGTWTDGPDLKNVRKDLAVVKSQLCVDEKRIFAVGHLIGGRMAERVACEPWVAAIATNSTRRDTALSYDCEDKPIPYFHIEPNDSPRLPLGGGTGCVLVHRLSRRDHYRAWWAKNECAPRRSKRKSPKGSECFAYRCKGAPFEVCELEGGAGWPGQDQAEITSPIRIGTVGGCEDEIPQFPDTEGIWQFFKRVGRIK
jgi:poly(3-hydroxybutyrate) depolymerase